MKRFLSIILIVVGVVLLLIPTITDQIIKHYSENIPIEEITADEIEENNKKQVEYDFSVIKDIEISSVINGALNHDNDLVVGTMKIPDLGISLPVMKGLSDANLISGVATMKEDQILGQGNYTLAGHYTKNKKILLGGILDISIGSIVYLSDKKFVYEYRIYDTVVVPDTALDMLLDEKAEERGKPILSLMTCYYTSKNGTRFFALGELLSTYPDETFQQNSDLLQ
ncbi:MAG: class A sortase [Clostridiales bacterium]|nr:class A sortase [Clostridiales bacterium]